MCSWRFWITFGVFLYMICEVFGPSFPKSPLCPNTHKASITQLSGDLGRKVRLDLMWNVELKTLECFSYVPTYQLWVWSSFPKLPLYPNSCWTSTTQHSVSTSDLHSVHLPPTVGGWASIQIFIEGGLGRISVFREGLLGKRWVTFFRDWGGGASGIRNLGTCFSVQVGTCLHTWSCTAHFVHLK